jgi:thiol-disulfide isomerase/thioredoxin
LPVQVTKADVQRGEVKLPEVSVDVVPVVIVGEKPELKFVDAENKPRTLSEHQGKLTIVHFWSSSCVPCKLQLPAVKTLHKQFAAKGLQFLSVSLDNDAKIWAKAREQMQMPWPQGRIAEEGSSGVSEVPAYWLLDAKGTLIANVDQPEQLEAALVKLLNK